MNVATESAEASAERHKTLVTCDVSNEPIDWDAAPSDGDLEAALGHHEQVRDPAVLEWRALCLSAWRSTGTVPERIRWAPPANDVIRTVKPRPAELTVESLNEQYAYVETLARVVGWRADGEIFYQRASDFKTAYNNLRVNINGRSYELGSRWLTDSNRRSFRAIGLWAPPRNAPDGDLNLWGGFAVAPVPGDWSRMRAHIRTVIAANDPALDEYIVRWLAWTVQNPGLPAEAALVFRGGQGTGKGTVGNAMCKIFGQHAAHITGTRQLAGGFNAHLAGKVFVFGDEVLWGGDKRSGEALKAMITEPSLPVEPKGVDIYYVDNVLHLIIAGNGDWVVPADHDDRRYVVCDVSEARVQDEAYFGPLQRELRSGGLEAMLHDLLTLDLGDWHPRRIVPTKGKRDQQERSLEAEERWLLGLLDEGVLPHPAWTEPPGKYTAHSAALLKHAQAHGARHASPKSLAKHLRQIGAIPSADTSVRGWQFPMLDDARAAWEEHYWKREWSKHDDWIHGDG